MTEGLAPVPPRPKSWEELFKITKALRDVPIEEVERGRVDWEYHFDAKDKRPCGRQGCEQMHAHGWLVALSGNRFVHIGNDCAHKYANAGLWSSNISTYRTRVSAEARISALLNMRDEAQRKQYWIDNNDQIAPAIALYESFTRQAQGPFLNEIVDRANRGRSTIEKERRLSNDEIQLKKEMLSGHRAEDRRGPYVSSVEMEQVGEIIGLECFRDNRGPRLVSLDLQRLVTTLLTWSPDKEDRDAERSLVRAKRELAPLSNQLNSTLVAVRKFFSESNLNSLMLLDVTRSQGITSIALDGAGGVVVTRRAHWRRVA